MYEHTKGIIDLGTEEQKEKLFKIEELVSSPVSVVLEQTDPTKWKIYPKRNQANSSSCVYQARAKAAGILREMETGKFVEYSAADYNKRSNRPSEGAYPVESFDFWVKQGIGLEHLEPSQNLSEQELAKIGQNSFEKDIAEVSKVKSYVGLPAYDFNTLVGTLKATNKPIPLGFFATSKEWNRDIPNIENSSLKLDGAPVRHQVCATSNFGIYKGEEGFTIEDSWGSTGIQDRGVRWITRTFFESRNYIPGLYPTTFKLEQSQTTLKVNLKVDLEFGMNHPDVFLLQQVYKHEGLFPLNHEGSTLFHNITLKCTQQFQVKYGIVAPGQPGYGRVGPKTRAKINELYS